MHYVFVVVFIDAMFVNACNIIISVDLEYPVAIRIASFYTACNFVISRL